MANARIAAIAFTILSATLVAQQSPTVQLSINVTDQTDAVIPNAKIAISQTPKGPLLSALSTNSSGDAAFEAAPGYYVLSVSAPGFKQLIQPVTVGADRNQSIRITLPIGSWGCGPCVTVDWVIIPIESDELVVPIPLLPLRPLAPLPARHHRSHP